MKRAWYRSARAAGRARRVAGTAAVVLAALVALVPGIRADVGDWFDSIYARGLEAVGQLPDDPMIVEVLEVSSTAEGSDPAFAVDGSRATGWSPAGDDASPVIQFRLPQRPDVNYVEFTVSGVASAAAIRLDLFDLALAGVPVIVEVDEVALEGSPEPQRFRIRASGVDRIDVRPTGIGPGFVLQEFIVLGGT